MRRVALIACVLLAGCIEDSGPSPQRAPIAKTTLTQQQMTDFQKVAATMEPATERACHQLVSGVNCDFLVLVDNRPGQPPNAFHTTDDHGRPLIVFTDSLIAHMDNRDEIAFVFGHEAAHHILQHIPQTQRSAVVGTLIGGILGAAVAGSGSETQRWDSIDTFSRVGGNIGARVYSVEHELEADELGAVIAHSAGYDAVRGVEIFNRMPDPGQGLLATHPPNADRVETVRRAVKNI